MGISSIVKSLLLVSIISSAVAQAPAECNVDADVGFILDSSGSIEKFYEKEKTFLNNIAAAFEIGNGGSRASVVTFSYNSELSIKFSDYDELQDFQDAVMKIPLMGYTTYMDRALRLAQKEMFAAGNGARAGKPKVLIMLTDGEQSTKESYEDPAAVVQDLRKSGIVVLVVGMGRNIKKKSVQRIAGGPQYSFSTKGFAKLAAADFLGSVRSTACDAAEESKSLVPPVTTQAPSNIELCPDTDIDYQGTDIKLDLNVATWQACGAACKANAECKYFTFVPKSGCCYHKSNKGAVKASTGLVSGNNDCP